MSELTILFALGCVLVASFAFSLIADKYDLPRVTAYLVTGVLFSESLIGKYLDLHFNSSFEVLINISLGIIAFIIGSKLQISELRKDGHKYFLITVFESLTPVFIVFIGMYHLLPILNLPIELAYAFAVISATTDPAASLAVINQYNAKGPLSKLLMNIAALDDILGILIFSFFVSFFTVGNDSMVLGSVKEILLSLLVGIVVGFTFLKLCKLSKNGKLILPLLFGVALVVEGLSEILDFSFLVSLIVVGLIYSNFEEKDNQRSLFFPLEEVEELIFIVFFSLAGLKFKINYFVSALPFIGAFFILRAVGKYIGSFIGSQLMYRESKNIQKYLGLTLLPQAGIAIGIVFQISKIKGYEEVSEIMLNAILGSTILFEFIGTLTSKYAFKKAGEV